MNSKLSGTGGVVYSVGRDGSDYKLIVNPESERLTPRALAEGPDGRLYEICYGVMS